MHSWALLAMTKLSLSLMWFVAGDTLELHLICDNAYFNRMPSFLIHTSMKGSNMLIQKTFMIIIMQSRSLLLVCCNNLKLCIKYKQSEDELRAKDVWILPICSGNHWFLILSIAFSVGSFHDQFYSCCRLVSLSAHARGI